jgi:hypothetical protein
MLRWTKNEKKSWFLYLVCMNQKMLRSTKYACISKQYSYNMIILIRKQKTTQLHKSKWAPTWAHGHSQLNLFLLKLRTHILAQK